MSYTTTETCRIVGITYRMADYWCRTDLVRPSLMEAQGSGTRRSYSYRDLVDLRILRSMLDAGMNLLATRKVLAVIRAQTKLDMASTMLVLTRDSVYLCTKDDLSEIVRQHDGMIQVLALSTIVESLDAELHPVLDAVAAI